VSDLESYELRTPENVSFSFELGGLATRALAWLIDLMVLVGLIMLIAALSSLAGMAIGQVASAIMFILIFAVQWFYFVVLEWRMDGRTLGKRALGLRVIDERGVRITFLQAAVRNLLRVADFLPGLYLVGGVCTLLDGRGRRLGDLAAATLVVRDRSSPMPSAIVPAAERYNSFIQDPHVRTAARRIDAALRETMVSLALRRERLKLPVRVELFARLAQHLEATLGVAKPPFFSDEKYVLNLTAVVLGAGPSSRSSGLGRPGA
jgi:uncharacterized RDD family membrane protein YckC